MNEQKNEQLAVVEAQKQVVTSVEKGESINVYTRFRKQFREQGFSGKQLTEKVESAVAEYNTAHKPLVTATLTAAMEKGFVFSTRTRYNKDGEISGITFSGVPMKDKLSKLRRAAEELGYKLTK